MAMEKTLIAFLTGVFMIMSAVVIQPLITQAAPKAGGPPERGPEKVLERLAADLSLSKDDVERYLQPGISPHELAQAALLAKASGKPLADVLAMKTLANSWQDVEQTLGITPETLAAMRLDMLAARLAADTPVAEETARELLRQRYAPPDIAMAAVLAQAAGKPAGEVLAMRKINNCWPDVAKDLGLSEEEFRAAAAKLPAMPPRHGPGQPPPGFMDGPEAGPGR